MHYVPVILRQIQGGEVVRRGVPKSKEETCYLFDFKTF